MIETLAQDLRYTLRRLSRNPGFAIAVILLLALGIGASTAIFSVVDAVLLRPLPYKNPGRLVMVWRSDLSGSPGEGGTLSYPDFLDWRKQNDVFHQMAAYRSGANFTLTGAGPARRLSGVVVSSDIFPLLGVKPLVGRSFLQRDDNPPATGGLPVMLSYRLWRSHFAANRSIAGRSITLNGKPFTIAGVMPRGFQFPIQAGHEDLWVTIAFDRLAANSGSHSITQRGWRYLEAVARLRPGATVEQAQMEMDTIAERLARQYPKTNATDGVWVEPALESVVSRTRPALLALFAAAGMLLLIACANAANLLLSHAERRRKEIAVRIALGAGRRRVIGQLLTESLTLAAIATAGGILLAWWGLRLLRGLLSDDIPRVAQIGIDGRVLGFALIVAIATGIIFGLAPALRVSNPNLTEALKENWHSLMGGLRGGRLRGILVVAEVALALVLLAGAGLFLRTFIHLEEVNLGFDPSHVLTFKIDLPEARYSQAQQNVFFEELLSRLRSQPGVRSAGAINFFPFAGIEYTGDFQIPGRPVTGNQKPGARFCVITPGYIGTMRIPLIKGRDFTQQDRSLPVAMINRTLAERYFPGQDPVGKQIVLDAPTEIVGVAGDVKAGGPTATPQPAIYTPAAENTSKGLPLFMTVVVRSNIDSSGLVSMVRSDVSGLDKDVPVYDIERLDQYVSSSVARPRLSAVLFSAFAGFALFLTALGLYAVVSYSVAQRTHEFGIRAALGADRAALFGLVIKQGLVLTLIGIGVGLGLAFAMSRFLSGMIFGLQPDDPFTLALVSLVLVAVAVLACYIPARRATEVDPITALREE